MDNKESLVKSLNKRLAALKMISSIASFKTRKSLANGIFMSKLIYIMPVWIGCEDFLINSLQVSQNKAARFVTRLDRFTPTEILLKQCGWLSVRQLLVFHSLSLLHKTHKHHKPTFLYNKITSGTGPPSTRQAVALAARISAAGLPSLPNIVDCKLEVTRKSWCWASTRLYSQLPVEVLTEQKPSKFKEKLKLWVGEHIDI